MDKRWKIARVRYLVPLTSTNKRLNRISDGYILTEDTKILEAGQYSEKIGQRVLNEYENDLKIIGNITDTPDEKDIPIINGVGLPGFVKGHGHDHESVLIGVARDLPLTTWLDESVNLFTGFMNEDLEKLSTKFNGRSPYLIAYLKARLDDISFGITTAVTHHCNFNKYYVDELVEANKKAGTRLFIAIGSQDRHYDERILDSVEDAIKRLDSYYNKYKDDSRIIIIPGPDQLFSNGPELLKALKQWANDHNTLVHIHSSEEPATTNWFIETYGMTPIEYADSIGFLDENTLLAHQVNNTKIDLGILEKTGSMIVHNPLANTILGSGMPPIIEMITRDIPVIFSTDGSGSADNQNMLNTARLASQYQKAYHKNAKLLTAEDVLRRITKIPAEILKINAGVLKSGKDADFIIADLNVPNLTPTRLETVVENLIWASAGNEISYVVANGIILRENYKFITMDKTQIQKDIQLLADLFEEYKMTAKKISGTGVHS
ncbi:MAG: amidohydrolase family protein [Candidatus Hodarchaeales archaeon]|jgi:5-methylthioadenosine/S-adenosylhomocysteine deaminase